ncbi:MAG: helix-hairpin-helix domain-containing protein [Candidatus Margulisbacteria bacterium]|nr:helix-hairpin-helix domain-containing protein [Candidatus Margulisiibacteriota bacterium]
MLLELTREQQLILLGLVLVIVSGLGVMAFRHFAADPANEILIEAPEPQQNIPQLDTSKIIVHITGAVKHEGVYKLKLGDRLIDALALAGGATALADLSAINLAEKVKDGQKVNIPVKQITVERVSGHQNIGRSEGTSGKISINAASEKDLCKVQGIGPTTAKKIIEYRSTNGPFPKIEDVMKVKSIGKSKFGKIKDQICI